MGSIFKIGEKKIIKRNEEVRRELLPLSYQNITNKQASLRTIAFMPESDRGREIIQTPTGLEATIIRRNAAGGKTRFSKRGTSAVVQCIDPETGLPFEASATELRVMAYKAQGMTHDEIKEELGVDSPSSITGAMDRLKLRLYDAGWETEGVSRNSFIAYAQRLGLLDGTVLDKITSFIQNSPPALTIAERVRNYKRRRKEEAAAKRSRR